MSYRISFSPSAALHRQYCHSPPLFVAQHEHYSISILVAFVYALTPLAGMHHILFYFFRFRFSALCLAAVCYTSSYLFHYIYGSIIFGLRSLFQEHN